MDANFSDPAVQFIIGNGFAEKMSLREIARLADGMDTLLVTNEIGTESEWEAAITEFNNVLADLLDDGSLSDEQADAIRAFLGIAYE